MMVHLNKEQQQASRPEGGIELVIAGAGTGKTKTLVEKVKNIILSSKFEPENVLILTFSRKAAVEIKERIINEIGTDAGKITSGTFHSFCLNFLKENSDVFLTEFKYDAFPKILDEDEKKEIIMELIIPNLNKFLGLPAHIIFKLMNTTDNLKKEMLEKLQKVGIIGELNLLKRTYKELKVKNRLIEFEDMIDFTIDLLKKFYELRQQTLQKYQYILVDEFQDVSDNNIQLLKLLLPDVNSNIFAVGDDFQSIFGFRGSKNDYIVNMKKYFPGVKIHKLQTNYRSKSEIVILSNNFIKINKIQTKKKLKSFRGKGGKVKYYYVKHDVEECKLVNKIYEISQHKNEDITLLYRNNYQGTRLNDYNLKFHKKKFSINSMTMHASKGLEFSEVIIMGVSDKIIPDRSTDIEEERRLFYVALTRAKDVLHIIIHLNDDGSLPVFAKELQ